MLEVTDSALEWMQEELDPNDDQGVNIFVRYGGEAQIKQGFSPAISVDSIPHDAETYNYDDITVFINESDLWYFEDVKLKVDIDDEEVTFSQVD